MCSCGSRKKSSSGVKQVTKRASVPQRRSVIKKTRQRMLSRPFR